MPNAVADRITPARKLAAAQTRSGFGVPRGLIAGTLAATALVWGPYAIMPRASLLSALVRSSVYLDLLLLTACSRRAKVLVVRTLQRYTINPLMRLLLAVGINPLGLAILETRGHLSGKTRRVPVGNVVRATRSGSSPNTAPTPATCATSSTTPGSGCGCASVCATAGSPACVLNAINVRVLGADLLTVHVQLGTAQAGDSAAGLAGDSVHTRNEN